MVTAELNPANPSEILLHGTHIMQKDLIKAIPATYWSKDIGLWRVLLSWNACLALRATFKDDLTIGPNLSEWAFNELETRIKPCLEMRDKLQGELYPDLYPHQNVDVEFLATAKRALLGNEQGVGKTPSAIRALLRVNELGTNPFPALVVAPNSMKLTWRAEFARWWPGVKVSVVKGTAVQRRKAFEANAHVTIINWEGLRSHSRLVGYGDIALRRCVACGGTEESITPTKCEVHPRELNEIPFKTVIADEVHRAKDPKSRQTRALKGATGNAEYRWGLSGTIMADSPGDLWSPLNWLEPEAYPSKVKYQERFCQIGYNGYGIEIEGLRLDTRDEFFQAFDPRFRRMTKAVVLPFLPPVVRETRWVEMNPKQSKAYKQMKEKMLAELDSGELLVATNRMTRMGRLLQFASSFGELGEPYTVVDKDTGREIEKQDLLLTDPSSKVTAFLDDLDDYGEQSLVVFGVSRQLINILSAHLNKAGRLHGLITGDQDEDEREMHKNRFQAGDTKLILCTIGAAREGLTLTAASTAVFLQRSWSRIDMEQAMARVHRIGSEVHDSITIVDYVAPDTAELAVIETLGDKGVKFEEVVRDQDLLRKVLATGTLAA